MAANYLSLLMSSVNVSSDDSDITNTQSTGQVDYLSHEWREEDVWHSWRRMTRQKNEIANGIRLENASWRTWWKQRNGLKTVNPETLNWLKDSDVTWLYGPLHTADDVRPSITRTCSSSASAAATRVNTPPPSPAHRHIDVSNPKPILKHRTVTELLISTLPPPGSSTGLVDVTSLDVHSHRTSQSTQIRQESSDCSPMRPALLHTRSETNIIGHSPFRKDSPPRIIASDSDNKTRNSDNSDHRRHHSPSTSSTPQPHQDISGTRKHIAFNTFVEQCIAIDKPAPYAESATSSVSFRSSHDNSPPSSPIQQRGPYEYVHYSPRPSYQQAWVASRERQHESDEEEDEEDARIEVKTRSRSSSMISRPQSAISSLDRDFRPSSSNGNRDRVTIASIAPTILKTSSHSHSGSPAASSTSLSGSRSRGSTYCRPHASELLRSPSESESDEGGDVPLVWVPPVGSGYERELLATDLDEPSAYAYKSMREPRGREGRNGWVVTPPPDQSLNDSDGRQGRFDRQRLEGKRRGRDPRSTKLSGSLSPAEVPSSNTDDSSESRSRSRHRTGLLPPRSGSRSRSRSSSAEERSNSPVPGSLGRVVSPEAVDRGVRLALNGHGQERGRPLVRRCDSDSDMRADKVVVGHVRGYGGIALHHSSYSFRSHTEAPPAAGARSTLVEAVLDPPDSLVSGGEGDSGCECSTTGASPPSSSGVSGNSTMMTKSTSTSTLSGIRGYIGSIWS